MSRSSVTLVNSLSLLALKVKPNVFDLSSGLHNVSIRDQVVRGQMVVRDLCAVDKAFTSLLVVGAGVAGMAAALEAANRGIQDVVVVEEKDSPFSLLQNVHHRFVGPFMYEWPSPFAWDQSYPEHPGTPWVNRTKSPLGWKTNSPSGWQPLQPMACSALYAELTKELLQRLSNSPSPPATNPVVYVQVTAAKVAKFLRQFVAIMAMPPTSPPTPLPSLGWVRSWPQQQFSHLSVAPDYVLIAAGMGKENLELVDTKRPNSAGQRYTGLNPTVPSFWTADTLKDPASANKQVSIFGGGDGALQDVIRALTKFQHPLEFIQTIASTGVATRQALDDATAKLIAIDRQGRLHAGWTVDREAYRTVDESCRNVAQELVRSSSVLAHAVIDQVNAAPGRIGKTSLFVAGSHFDKAYLLNRFAVWLLWESKRHHSTYWGQALSRSSTGPVFRMDFEVYLNRKAIAYKPWPGGGHEVTLCDTTTQLPIAPPHTCDEIVVRYGIDKATIPAGQMIKLSPGKSALRTTMNRIEVPFVPEKD